MAKLPMCRVCLVENVRMYVVVNKSLQQLYEKLTDVPFVSKDIRPMLACYFCCSKLKQCWQFQRKCLEAEELFTQMLQEDYKLNPLRSRDQLQFCGGFVKTPLENIDVNYIESVAIKEEEAADFERLIIEPKEELLSDDIEEENEDNGYSDVDDIPRHYSESDSEVPTEGDTEVKEEQEETMRKTKAKKITRAPVNVTKKPNLEVRRAKFEDTITEEKTEIGQSDSKNIRNSRNCMFEAVTELKKPFTNLRLINDINNTDVDKSCRNNSYHDVITCEISKDKGIDNDDVNERRILYVKEKRFKCEVCKRSFSQKSNLKRHIRTHTGEKPFECDICLRSFIQKSTLTDHLRTHTGEKPYKCDMCSRSFSTKSCLTSHLRTHARKKPHKYHDGKKPLIVYVKEERFKCEVCQRIFKQKNNLTRHIRTHTGEKPYKCDICLRSFRQKGTLTDHLRTHTGEKPYKCDMCSRSFSTKCQLTSHLSTHTNVTYVNVILAKDQF